MVVQKLKPWGWGRTWAIGAVLAGCTGQVGGAPGANGIIGDDSSGGGTTDPRTGQGAVGGGAPNAAGCSGAVTPGASPMRRLTPAEYTNTVRDLFHATDLPAVTLAADQVVKTFGFDDNAEVQAPAALLVSQYEDAALSLTASAFAHPERFMPCAPKTAGDEAACGQQLVTTFGQRAFRRPLTSAEQKQFGDFFESARTSDNFNVAAQLTVQAMLQSSSFLYKVEFGTTKQSDASVALSPWELASRLSYLIWNSMPDDALFASAQSGKITNTDEIETQARRMLADDKAHVAMDEFHAQWLGYRTLDTVMKDKTAFPSWTDDLRTALRSEATHAVDEAIFGASAGYDNLLSSRRAFVTPALADLYQVTRPANAAGDWVDLDGKTRQGFITQAWWLAALAHPLQPAPVLRGQFIMAKLLCTPPPPPPPGVNTALPTSTADARTNRQRLEMLHTIPPTCAGCHKTIDGIGFGLEGYDAVGAYRTMDNGAPVDDSGEVILGSDVDGPFKGGVELAAKLSKSEQVKACITTQWFRFGMGHPESDADACTLQSLGASFKAGGYQADALLVAMAKSPAFRNRLPVVVAP